MALQKWAAPAGSPLLTTLTLTGSPGNQPVSGYDATFAADGDIVIGTTVEIRVAGKITTTGSPTLRYAIAFNSDPLTGLFAGSFDTNTGSDGNPLSAPADVTDAPWSMTYRGIQRSTTDIAYHVVVEGLSAAAQEYVGVFNGGGLFTAVWGFGIAWSATHDDADSGDIITVYSADALWIG